MKPDLSVNIAGIKMQNPIMNCAGTFEIDCYKELVNISKLGAFVPKSVTLLPREGNPQPRIYEVLGGMINRIGLENKGVKNFVAEKLPLIFSLLPPKVVLIVNIAGDLIEEYVETAVIIEDNSRGRIAALEINVSCPNVENGLIFGSDPNLLWELVMNLKSKISLPLIIKLTPNVTDIDLVAKAVVSAGADVLSLINTVKAAAYIWRSLHAGEWIEGGLSGPVIKPIALMKVREVAKAVDVPIIAMGGISNTEDALEFLMIKNVWAIAVGTATFANPKTMTDIVDGLYRYLLEKNYANIAELKQKEGIL